MAGYPVFEYNDMLQPLQFVDHPQQRLHQHQSLLNILAHKTPDQRHIPNRPDVDVSDMGGHYLLELEVPGVKDPDAISCQFTSWRCLVVTGTTTRGWHHQQQAKENGTGEDTNGFAKLTRQITGDLAKTKTAEEAAAKKAEAEASLLPELINAERRIGAFRRQFNFPEDVDMEKLTAKLDAGLLSIHLPKRHHSAPKGSGKVKIQGPMI
ncbi:hypothetical protein LTR36_005759 [Oleoguttula mirabilis]|uniref:SHSP domain-containing protein n=1 Tax=Oleoguttula mirabilis TaxID=1507867 RepID=A0AAV9JEJ9_9PEZI|nr:hypothetical protein LTR36_005759 [Oleoguttula mirabilis]